MAGLLKDIEGGFIDNTVDRIVDEFIPDKNGKRFVRSPDCWFKRVRNDQLRFLLNQYELFALLSHIQEAFFTKQVKLGELPNLLLINSSTMKSIRN